MSGPSLNAVLCFENDMLIPAIYRHVFRFVWHRIYFDWREAALSQAFVHDYVLPIGTLGSGQSGSKNITKGFSSCLGCCWPKEVGRRIRRCRPPPSIPPVPSSNKLFAFDPSLPISALTAFDLFHFPTRTY
jgi:hypothetical protein